MNAVVESKLEQIRELCVRYHVRRLDLFGSATSDRFDPSRSDVDFLVEFAAPAEANIADDFFGLIRDLEALLGHKVDLLSEGSIENPYLKASIEHSRQRLYAA